MNISAATSALCELLALVFGVGGRRHLPGKVAGVGSRVLIGLTHSAFISRVFR
jgi:hypothetical protein